MCLILTLYTLPISHYPNYTIPYPTKNPSTIQQKSQPTNKKNKSTKQHNTPSSTHHKILPKKYHKTIQNNPNQTQKTSTT
jgi:hypothetical protein